MQSTPNASGPSSDVNYGSACTYDVYLGGSYNPTTWRHDLAIPYLQKAGLTYFNPQVVEWTEKQMEIERAAKENSTVLLYVVDSQARNAVTGIEIAQLAGYYKDVVVVIIPQIIVDGFTMNGEQINLSEARDVIEFTALLRQIIYDQDMYEFNNVTSSLAVVEKIVLEKNRESYSPPVKQDPAILRNSFKMLALNDNEISMCHTRIAIRWLTNHHLCNTEVMKFIYKFKNDKHQTRARHDGNLTFKQYCAAVEKCLMWPKKRNCRFQKLPVTGEKTHLMPVRFIGMRDVNDKTVDIYLVGQSSSENLWKKSIAIPMIKQYNNLTFNGARNTDFSSMLRARVLLFVVTDNSRCMDTMTSAAYCIAKGCRVVLCVQDFTHLRCTVGGEKLTTKAMDEFNRGRTYLKDLASRENVPVFESITGAVERAIKYFL